MSRRAGGVETFDVGTFDAAIRGDFANAQHIGIRNGEHVWVIPIVPDASIGVIIRSSIRDDGASAGAGRDSIRAWIGRIPDGSPYAPKVLGRWTTRRPRWAARLRCVIAELLTLARNLRPCPSCGAWMKIQNRAGNLLLHCDARAEGFLDFGPNGSPMEIPGPICGTEMGLVST